MELEVYYSPKSTLSKRQIYRNKFKTQLRTLFSVNWQAKILFKIRKSSLKVRAATQRSNLDYSQHHHIQYTPLCAGQCHYGRNKHTNLSRDMRDGDFWEGIGE